MEPRGGERLRRRACVREICTVKKNLPAFLRYTKGYRVLLLLGLAIIIAESLLTFITPLIMGVTIDTILGGKPLNTPAYFRWFATLIVDGDFSLSLKLLMMGGALLLLTIVSGVLQFIRAYANNIATENINKRLRDRIYSHVQRLPFKWHSSIQTGDIIQRATNDVDQIRRFLNGPAVELLRVLLVTAAGVWLMFSLDVTFAFAAIPTLPLTTLFSILYYKWISKLTVTQEEAEGTLFSVIQENLSGARVVRAFGRQAFELNKFDDKNEDNRAKLLKLNFKFAELWTVLDLITGIGQTVIVLLGIYLVVTGRLTVGDFAAFSAAYVMVIWPLRNFGRTINALSHNMVAVGRIEEVLTTPEESELDEGETPPLTGDVVFSDVQFGYSADSNVLNGLNLTIPAGKTVAFLGGTGSGKSTLALLLPRLYDLTGGSISIGGTDITKIRKTHLRDRIGIVLQEPFLYSKSIRENIGIKRQNPSLDEIIAAAQDACIHDDIVSFADGYDTIVGERGVTLSGGQKQRVAIARALMGDSDILIFDDSLSAVDTKTDSAIRSALRRRRQNVTTLIISHRTATLMEADCIFVLRNGSVAEFGSHDELMLLTNGIYRRTFDTQNASSED
jgi:ATP-binding cassette subfamily B protein